MIIVNLKGGLGNQMFQYALGRHLALKNQTELKLDIGGLARANAVGDIYRPFDLDEFSIQATIATQAEIEQYKNPYGLLSKLYRYAIFKLYRDKNTLFYPYILKKKQPYYLDGYWQSPLYFASIRDVLLQDFTPKSELSDAAKALLKKLSERPSVSLHVRRGDYIKNPRVQYEFGPCTERYYQTALAYVLEKIPQVQVVVFSDDTPWVQETLSLGSDTIYASDAGLKTAEELYLMSQTNHIITSNSTFSWWAAWLNNHPDKIVITPTPWFDHQPYDSSLISPTWIQLPK